MPFNITFPPASSSSPPVAPPPVAPPPVAPPPVASPPVASPPVASLVALPSGNRCFIFLSLLRRLLIGASTFSVGTGTSLRRSPLFLPSRVLASKSCLFLNCSRWSRYITSSIPLISLERSIRTAPLDQSIAFVGLTNFEKYWPIFT